VDKFGKCSLSPIVEEDDAFLVTGIKTSPKVEYQYCSIVRQYGPCGPEGKWFQKREGYVEWLKSYIKP
jgi:hypothetical protein